MYKSITWIEIQKLGVNLEKQKVRKEEFYKLIYGSKPIDQYVKNLTPIPNLESAIDTLSSEYMGML